MTERPIRSLGGTPYVLGFATAMRTNGTTETVAVVEVEPEPSPPLPEPVRYYWPSQDWLPPTLTVPLAYSEADERRRTRGLKTDTQRPVDEDERKRAQRKREKAARKRQRGQR
jgi:hypothetical protein